MEDERRVGFQSGEGRASGRASEQTPELLGTRCKPCSPGLKEAQGLAVLFRDGWLLRRVVGKVGCHRPHPQHRRKLPDTFDAQPQDKKFIMADLTLKSYRGT